MNRLSALVSLLAVSLVAGALAAPVVSARANPLLVEADPQGLRVYVVVLDSLMSHEVGPLTPTLSELRAEGTWYEQARAVFPAETLPNHAAMMTGVPPSGNGIIGNDWWPGGGPFRVKMEQPSLLDAPTLTTLLENNCDISTDTVLSKGYLWGVFRGEEANADDPVVQRQADYHWNPRQATGFYISDPDDHVLDVGTVSQGLQPWLASDTPTPQFAFVNLGDIDRSGHVDVSGVSAPAGPSAFRQAALENTDALLGRVVEGLKTSGAWDETVLIITSDHGMDWSVPDQNYVKSGVRSINITAELTRDALAPDRPYYTPDYSGDEGVTDPNSQGDFATVPGGGSASIYLEDPDDIADVARRLAVLPGVAMVATPEPVDLGEGAAANATLSELGMDHPHNGEVVVFVKQGWSIRDTRQDNPLPGNHGHPATQHSVLLVAGGHPALDDEPESVPGEVVYDPVTKPLGSPPAGGPGNLSIAPTVMALFGLDAPASFVGKPLVEAFDQLPLATSPACSSSPGLPDVAIDISDSPDPVKNGHALTYTLTATNIGSAEATGATLVDELPSGVKPGAISSSQGNCSIVGQLVTCLLGDIAAGDSATITIESRVRQRGTLTDSGSVTINETDADNTNNQSTETTAVE